MRMYNVTIQESGMAGTMTFKDVMAETMIDAMQEMSEFYCGMFGLGDALVNATAERVEEKS
jgi:hypothetical protein